MKKLIVVLVVITFAIQGLAHNAQNKPELDMGKMQMVFLVREAAWKGNEKAVAASHEKVVEELLAKGGCALSGRVWGDPHIYEIMVFKTENQNDAEKVVSSLPGVKSGMLKPDYIQWYAARSVIKTAVQPIKQVRYFFGILERGDKWTPGETEESKKIQDGHMANINRLNGLGKLVLAGPYFGDGARRGVFIYKVNSAREAQELTDTDPAVKAGRLKIRLLEWQVPAGILP